MKNQNMIIGCVLSAIIAGGAGFYGGTKYQSPRSLSRAGQFAGRGTAGQNIGSSGRGTNGSAQPGLGLRGGAVLGEVTAKDDKSLTIKLSDGSSKIVILSDSTTYRTTSESGLDSVEIGMTISSFGESNTDGSLTASNVEINPVGRGMMENK